MDQTTQPTADPVVTSEVTETTPSDAAPAPPEPPPEPTFDATGFVAKFDAALQTKEGRNLSAAIQHVSVVLGADSEEVYLLRNALRKLITG